MAAIMLSLLVDKKYILIRLSCSETFITIYNSMFWAACNIFQAINNNRQIKMAALTSLPPAH